jgi:hypothetical protein
MGLSGLIIQTIKMQLFRLYENKVKDDVFVVCNFTQVIHYRINSIPRKGKLKRNFNSDAKNMGGSAVKILLN